MENCLRLVLFTVVLLASSNAAVHFKNSLILDEFDVSGHESVSLDGICKSDGCKIYVSAVKDADFIDNLSFKTGEEEEVALTNTTYHNDPDSRQKIPFVVKKGDSISIVNANENLACGPIVVYAISNSAPNFDVARVYDVSNTHGQEQALGKVVTVMGPRPFTVWASSPSEKMEASVFTTGFDIEEGEKCSEVYHSTRGLGIKYGVNGPITTLFFTEEVQLNVDFLEFVETELDQTSATFLSSPGFIGCAKSRQNQPLQVYHSSLYDSQVNLTLKSDIARTTLLEASLNTEDPLTLRIDGDPEKERTFTGSIVDASYTRSGEISATELSFSYSMTDPDASFLVKFTDLGITTVPTTRRTMPPTSPRTRATHATDPTTMTTTTAATTTSGAAGASSILALTILMTLLFQ